MHQVRPDLTSHEQLIKELTQKINDESLYSLSDTDIVKIAAERMWKQAFPDRELPKNLKRKRYVHLQF